MNRTLIVAMCWVFVAVAGAEDSAFKDDFSGYAPGPLPAGAWESVAGTGQWKIQDKQLVADAQGGLCQWRKVPELDTVKFSARLTVRSRRIADDWATAGLAVILDGRNHWRLNFVEGPDKRRYIELGETFDAKWQAQSEGSTALARGGGPASLGAWEYGKEYLVRIELSPREISGEVSDAESGRTLGRHSYLWGNADGVKFGRPGFSSNGLALAVSSVDVVASLSPATAAGLPAVEMGAAGQVAVLRDLPGSAPAIVDVLTPALRRAGFGVTLLSVQDFTTPAAFNSQRFDYVVLVGSHLFPVKAKDNFLRFLRNGGHCVVLGGNVFEEPAAQFNGRWYSRADIETELATLKPETILLETHKAGLKWRRGSDVTPSASAVVVQDNGLRFEIKGLKGWDTFFTGIPAPSKGQTLICFRAKGDANTPQMTVEVDEQDGSRWLASVELATEWKSVVLTPERFTAWEAKALKKKAFTPANAAGISFGIASNFNPRVSKGDHTFWVDSIGAALSPLCHIDLTPRVELNIFEDYEPYHLENVVSAGSAPGNTVTPRVELSSGSFRGVSAVGFAFHNESTFIPLLSTFDTYGRDCGWAAGMLVNYGGAYRGSTWIFSGIENAEFYAAPAVLDTLAAAMKAAKGGLTQTVQAEAAAAKTAELKLGAPAPQGFIRLSADGKHLVYPSGKRFFMSGCNHVGPFDRCGGRLWRDEFYTADGVEEDFRKAHAAGLNSMRYWVSTLERDIAAGDFRKVNAIRECARKYGVYLLLDLPGTGLGSVEDMVASHKAIAGAFKDEPMVIGYDLRNEPYVSSVASLRYGAGEKPPIVTTNFLAMYGGRISAKQVNDVVALRPDWLHLPRYIDGQAAENVTAATMLWSQYTRKYQIESSTTVGLSKRLPADAEFGKLVDAVDKSFDLWTRLQIAAVRSVDSNHLITIGYNTVLTALPCNRQLDFVSHHVYTRPFSLNNVLENVTEFDRLATVWPDKPITFGEFGYSTGIPMTNGYLDRYTASVGEMIHYLYAFSKGYDGVKKWMLNDWPLKIMQHYGDWNKGLPTRIYEERFGLYYYDGTPLGRPKPIVHALREFGEHCARVEPSGELEIVPAPLSIGAGYVYRNKQALFVGNTSYTTADLTFAARRPANVMLRWDENALRVTSSADTQARLKPSAFGNFGTTVTGRHGTLRTEGDLLSVELLEGETILIK